MYTFTSLKRARQAGRRDRLTGAGVRGVRDTLHSGRSGAGDAYAGAYTRAALGVNRVRAAFRVLTGRA